MTSKLPSPPLSQNPSSPQKELIKCLPKVLKGKRSRLKISRMERTKDRPIAPQSELVNTCTRLVLLTKENSSDINSMDKEDKSSPQNLTFLTTSAPSKTERRMEMEL